MSKLLTQQQSSYSHDVVMGFVVEPREDRDGHQTDRWLNAPLTQ
jgi:hypothetical protein